uniref:Uncharacterized protein n=1 Tax=Rousettus aegyptiacus TaxID=9407 RepID=A0A7J8CHV3_ROUAE|nr:hypothetical protein HJG63_008997 [Rousettus aegyptiacus]
MCVPTPLGNQAKEIILGQVICALYTPHLLSLMPLAQGSEEPKPHGLRTPPTFPSASGALKPYGFISFLAQDRPGTEGSRTEGVWTWAFHRPTWAFMPWTVDGKCAVIYFVYSVCKCSLHTQ